MDVSDRDAILQKIAKAEKKLADLLRQKEETEVELHSLRERLEKDSDQNIHSPISVSTTTILTPDDKVTLFLRLFRGRSDVYPKLWQNPKSGKKGYSPACANEWGEVKTLVQWTKEVHRTTGQDVRAGAS